MRGCGSTAMKAIVQDRYGSADVLELREVDRPAVGADEVLVRVRAAGVDQGVWHLMAGQPYLARLMGVGFRAPKVPVRGFEVAGRVEAAGGNAAGFQPGDEVFGSCEGAPARSPSTPAPEWTGSRPSPRISASSRPPPSRSRASPLSRLFATGRRFEPGSASSSSARAEAWAPSPCSSPRRSERR